MRHCWESFLVHFERPQSGIFSCKEAKTQGSIRGRLRRTFPNYIGNVSLSVLNSLQTRSKPIFPRSEEYDQPNPRGMNYYEVKKNSEGISLPPLALWTVPKDPFARKGANNIHRESFRGWHWSTLCHNKERPSNLPKFFHATSAFSKASSSEDGAKTQAKLWVYLFQTFRNDASYQSTKGSVYFDRRFFLKVWPFLGKSRHRTPFTSEWKTEPILWAKKNRYHKDHFWYRRFELRTFFNEGTTHTGGISSYHGWQ